MKSLLFLCGLAATILYSREGLAAGEQMLELVKRTDLRAAEKQVVLAAFFETFIAQAETEWRGVLLEQVLRLQSLLHESVARGEVNESVENAIRTKLVDDEVEWRSGISRAERSRARHIATILSLLPREGPALLRALALTHQTYDRQQLEQLTLQRALAVARRDLAETERVLVKTRAADSRQGKFVIQSPFSGFTLPEAAVQRSSYANALDRNDRARERLELLTVAAAQSNARLLDSREHIEADLFLTRANALLLVARSKERQECAKEGACTLADALDAYEEVVALKRAWLRLHAEAAGIESQVWSLAVERD